MPAVSPRRCASPALPGSLPSSRSPPAFSFSNFVGGEFMPALEEGNLWIRADMQQDISFRRLGENGRRHSRHSALVPEVTQVVSQMGRPDDGTDVSTFNNIEFLADLKPRSFWRPQFHGDKNRAHRGHSAELSAISRRRFQLLAKYSRQRGRGDVRSQGRKLPQAFRRRLRPAHRGSPIKSRAS